MNAMRDDFGVGVRGEVITRSTQLGTQGLVVFDDAVVHDREPIRRNMRMRIALGRHAMGRPASVRDADGAVSRGGVDGVLQHLHLAHRTHALERARAIEHGDTRRVVATVLEPPQALDQDGDDISLRDRADNSAHVLDRLPARHDPGRDCAYFAPFRAAGHPPETQQVFTASSAVASSLRA